MSNSGGEWSDIGSSRVGEGAGGRSVLQRVPPHWRFGLIDN